MRQRIPQIRTILLIHPAGSVLQMRQPILQTGRLSHHRVSVVQEFANVETVEPLPQSVNTQDVINQIVESARVILTEDKTSMELQLNPQNLGKIILKVTEQEGAVTAKIMTQNAVVKRGIRSPDRRTQTEFRAGWCESGCC